MNHLDPRLEQAWWVLRIGFGVVPFLAGLDKFLNLLTDWTMYLNPLVTRLSPLEGTTFMHVIGLVEMTVGLAILTRWTRLGAYIASAWLVAIALNLVFMGQYFDIAARDLLLALAALVLARLTEARFGAADTAADLQPAVLN